VIVSKNFKRPPASLRNAQPGEQIQQDQYHSTPDIYSSNGSSQFKVPLTPRFDAQPGEQIQQDQYYSTPDIYLSNGARQFRVPLTLRPAAQTGEQLAQPAIPLPSVQPATVDPRIRERVARYAQWLQINNNLAVSPQKIQAYQDAALETKKVGKREVRTFAPFQEQNSALQVITTNQITMLAMLAISWILGLFFLHFAMFTITFGIITLLYICGFIASGILSTNSFSGSSGEKIDEEIIIALDQLGAEWPTYTILCPLYKETAIVPQFIEAIKTLDYPMDKLQVLFLTEENDNETRAALYSMPLHPSFTILTVPKGSPQTKPRACNFGLLQAKGQFIVIFDAEDKPEPSQLKKAVLTFANLGSEVACVQAKLNYYNSTQNLLTRWFTAEYSTWFDIMLPGLQRTGFSLPLGGTSNHFRTEVLRALGGWDAFNVTEDCDIGLRISQYNLKTAVLDSTTYEEAASRFKTWLFQRSRWIKGYLQTYLVHMRHPFQTLRQGHFRKFFSLQLIVGAWTIVLFINPFMWALTLLYFLFHPVQLYSMLFPGPILYLGGFCLIFGNFFYIYIHLLGCLRRKEYSLIKWVLLLPLYWVMMSASAYIAFYQLIVKPHYWEKTQHGNHLAPSARAQTRTSLRDLELGRHAVVASMPTMRIFAVTAGRVFKRAATSNEIGTTTQRVTALRSTLSTQLGKRKVRRQIRLPHFQDRWLIVTLIVAVIASISSTYYVFTHHLILSYGDANSHLEIARRVFDNATPGLAQLGGVWLPLPHLLMIPFVWNDYLWMTGLAGSFVGMGCYLVTAIYIFLAARRLNHNSFMSFVGTLVYILNPNVLYLQATPLTEPVCQATFTMTGYYLLAWVQEDERKYLVLTAISTLLATLARYDGWILVVIYPAIIILTGLVKRFPIRKIEGYLLAFTVLGTLGIILWLIWGQIIFGDPLYFQRSAFSSQAQTSAGVAISQVGLLRHNLPADLRFYTIDCVETLGTAVSLFALLAIVLFVFRQWKRLTMLAAMAFLAPFAFYIAALFNGQVGLFDSHVTFYPLGIIPTSESVHIFNARFGTEMVAPAAVFIATLIPGRGLPNVSVSLRRAGLFLLAGLLILSILIQSVWISFHGAITIVSDTHPPFCANSYPINVYLAQHYNGGRILQTAYPFHLSVSQSGIHFSNVIYEGNKEIWPQALRHPATIVTWVILQPGDIVATSLAQNDPAFTQEFTLVTTSPYGMRLYHRNGLPPLPTRPLSSYLLSEQQFCNASNYPNSGGRFGMLPYYFPL
jgi:cellulose synthase/poly-beta-1,6-N-acetylglucosamine synthase-like glycosyltransferase